MSKLVKSDFLPFTEGFPESWELIPNKYLFEENTIKVGNEFNKYQLLSLTTKGVKEKDINSSGGKVPDSYEKYLAIKKGQMIFCLFDLDVSAVFSGIAHNNGMITSAYNAYDSKNVISNEYADYWFKYVFSNRYYKMFSKNIRYTITGEMFNAIRTPVPSKKEQNEIVNFLNDKEIKIEQLIINQERQIERLKIYRQALITKLVTKGLNPNVTMKDSGVESIGDVPSHWTVCRSKYIFKELSKGAGISKDEVFADGDIQCIRYGEIYSKYDISFCETYSKTKEEKIPSKVFLSYGDIVFSATGELVEEIGKNVVYLGSKKCLAGGDIIIGRHNEDPEFLNYVMYCSASQTQKSKGKAKLKVVHISATNIGDVVVALPPIEEQKEISSYLNKKITTINSIISLKNRKIEELNEYKKSIIYEYVTGKKLVID